MKLKSDYITHVVEDTQYLVGVSDDAFKGVVRSNETAAFIVDCLKEETTKDEIIDKMAQRYEGGISREIFSEDVDRILDKLRSINALEE